MIVSVYTIEIPIRELPPEPGPIPFVIDDMPLGAILRRAEFMFARSALEINNAAAFPLFRFHFSFDPTVTLKAPRSYVIIPKGVPAEIPDKSEYVCTVMEPPVKRGEQSSPLMLWEIIE